MKNNQNHKSDTVSAEVFICYASQNRDQVQEIVLRLEAAGVRVWRDQEKILGGSNFDQEIIKGIKGSKVLMLMCTDASLRSKNVRQEIHLAWKYDVPLLPLLLEPVSFPEQIEYFLVGLQWIEVLGHPHEKWFPQALCSIESICRKGSATSPEGVSIPGWQVVQPTRLMAGLEGLRKIAGFTDQIWPLPCQGLQRGLTRSVLRDLGAPQDNVKHIYRLGSQVCLAIEADQECHLLLLDEGTSGKTYCLCPSQFADNTSIPKGRSILPQIESPYSSFVVSGAPGREHLLAILTDEPLDLDWMPVNPKVPARVLNQADIDNLIKKLNALEGNKWTALSTYFDVIS
ncbi:MAG: TIR domain-containing protein [Thermodesulfobacteriota bacterium]|nr:TIR domain-containing protein [Thermodesulfobacteriota bacterium]